jgi:hypothetical protein
MRSVAAEVAKAPPRLAFEAVRYAAIASITSCGVCDPPVPSR